MKILSILLITSILSGQIALAEGEAVSIRKNDPAPFAGVLLSNEKANELNNGLNERDQLKLLNESYTKTIKLYKDNEDLYNNKVNTLLTQNDKLAQSLYDARETTAWERFGWFALGVVGTSLAVYGVKKATQ